jgi:hypothetical protein
MNWLFRSVYGKAFLISSLSLSMLADAPVLAEEMVVELMDSGQDPKRELRFAPKEGESQTMEMLMDFETEMTVSGQAMPAQAMPAQKMIMVFDITDVADNGDISYDFHYSSVEIVDEPGTLPQIKAAMEQATKGLVGAKGKGVITNRGISQKFEMDLPEDADMNLKTMFEGMKDSMSKLSSPVPEEAVGVGAKWKVVQPVVANGMTLTQTSTHEIVSMEKDGFTMSVTITQDAEKQPINNPMLPPGTTITLESLDTTGEGTSKLMMNSILPVESETTVNSDVTMNASIGGQNQQIQSKTKVEMSIGSSSD